MPKKVSPPITLGRIVHVVDIDHTLRVGLVVAITPQGNPDLLSFVKYPPFIYPILDAPYDETGEQVNSWHWPAKV